MAQPKQAPNPQAIGASMASSQATPRSAHMRPHGLEHGGRAAGVDGRAAGVVALEQDSEQVGDEAAVAGVAVLARQPDLRAVEEIEPPGIGPIPEAEQDPGGDARGEQLPAPDRERRGADTSAHQDRSSGFVGDLVGRREGPAERPVDPEPLPRLERGESRGPGADRLHQEVQADAALLASGIGDRERSRQVRAPAVPSPPGLRGQHVELAGGRLGTGGVQGREDPVAAGGEVSRHLAAPTAKRGGDPLAQPRRPRWPSPLRWLELLRLMEFLERADLGLAASRGEDRPGRRGRAGHRRHAGDAVADGLGPDLIAVGPGAGARRRVDDEVDLTADGCSRRRSASPRRSS